MDWKHILAMVVGALVAYNLVVGMGGAVREPGISGYLPSSSELTEPKALLALAGGAYAGWWVAKKYL